MSVLYIILVLVVLGVLLWVINRYVPMQPTIKTILNVVIIIIIIIWLLKALGVWDWMASAKV